VTLEALKIFHGPIEIAGQIGALCSALEQEGHEAMGYNFFHTYLNYRERLLNLDSFELGLFFEKAIRYYDLFHYHYGLSVYTKFKDLELLAGQNKPIVMHHWGSDVRTHELARRNNPYVYTSDCSSAQAVHRSLSTIGQYVQDAIVQDLEVLPYVQGYYRRVHVIPLAIRLTDFAELYPSLTERNPLVLHAPTNRAFKGTDYVEQAIERLRKELPFRYVRVEKMPHDQAVRLYRQADIIVDQILCGSYGLLSVEGMAYGKPVIAYVRDDLWKASDPKPAIRSANPDTVYEVLKRLLVSPELRERAGREGRLYVQAVHDSRIVVQKVLEVYRLSKQALSQRD
jgi:glycosyltransferase involved in cell wall biosynthesis